MRAKRIKPLKTTSRLSKRVKVCRKPFKQRNRCRFRFVSCTTRDHIPRVLADCEMAETPADNSSPRSVAARRRPRKPGPLATLAPTVRAPGCTAKLVLRVPSWDSPSDRAEDHCPPLIRGDQMNFGFPTAPGFANSWHRIFSRHPSPDAMYRQTWSCPELTPLDRHVEYLPPARR